MSFGADRGAAQEDFVSALSTVCIVLGPAVVAVIERSFSGA